MLEWLPAAIHDPHGTPLAWAVHTNPKAVLHTTETTGWPGYQSWTVMPHATVQPIPGRGVTVRQHLPFMGGAYALLNQPGGVETNRAYCFQFELIGTCDPFRGIGYQWTTADDAVLADLHRKVVAPLSAAFGIPIKAPRFLSYPASAGESWVRFSGPAWLAYSGWLGHQHVPENDHGDPGRFPWDRLTSLGDDMPITQADADLIARTILSAEVGRDAQTVSVGTAVQRAGNGLPIALSRLDLALTKLDELAPSLATDVTAAVVAALPATGTLTADQIQGAVRAGILDALRAIPA